MERLLIKENTAVPVLVEGIVRMKEELDSILETLVTIADKDLLKGISAGLRDIKQKKVISYDELLETHRKLKF